MSGEGSADDQPPETAIEPTEDQPPPEEPADELAQREETQPTDKGSESEGENGAEEVTIVQPVVVLTCQEACHY